ncbi:GatB/YqeY domain-containing protein [Streptomyces sp. KR80]|uniref:GatB/YqeY domain-containing protein n=1 Tax=Streptomyces sp. KR80 TaxID=3457426 RepID=UPI003FD02778
MTTLKAKLQDDLTAAIKARDELRSSTLRLTLSAITTAEVAGKTARELSDDEVQKVIAREAKKRREAAEAFTQGGRADQAERERAEGEVLAEYLPKQLSDEELGAIVAEAVKEAAVAGAEGPRAMGAVMKIVNPKVAGRAEGGRVAAEVKRLLAAG